MHVQIQILTTSTLKLQMSLWLKWLKNRANVKVYFAGGIPKTDSNHFFHSSSFLGRTCNIDVWFPQITQVLYEDVPPYLIAVSSSAINS